MSLPGTEGDLEAPYQEASSSSAVGGVDNASLQGQSGAPWSRFEVPGLGYLVLDEGQGRRRRSLNAHCQHGHGLCRLNRSLLPGRNPAQGRPVGLLLAWLRAPCDSHRFLDREQHLALSRCANDPAVSFEARTAAREWAATVPELQAAMALERAPREGEGVEPQRLA